LKKKKRGKPLCKGVLYLPKRAPYSRILQIGIYRREYLLNLLKKEHINAWQVEAQWNKEAAEADKGVFDDIIGVKNQPIFFVHGIQKGMWKPSVKRMLKKRGYLIDESRATMKKREEFVLRAKEAFSSVLPNQLRVSLKRFLTKLGFKFAIDN
jgi:hypothetical protein